MLKLFEDLNRSNANALRFRLGKFFAVCFIIQARCVNVLGFIVTLCYRTLTTL